MHIRTDCVVHALSAALTPLLAVVAGYVAYRQYRTARDKLRLDLFDRRLQIYTAVSDCLRGIVSTQDLTPEALDRLMRALWGTSAAAPFLFGPDVRAFLSELNAKSARLSVTRALAYGPQVSASMADDASREMNEILDWMNASVASAEAVFESYLSFRQVRHSSLRSPRSWLTRR